MSLSFIRKRPITHFALDVEILILSTKGIVRKNLEGKTGTKCLTSLRGRSLSTRRNIPVVNCRISYLTQRDQSSVIIAIVTLLMSRIHSKVCFLHLKVLPVVGQNEIKKKRFWLKVRDF